MTRKEVVRRSYLKNIEKKRAYGLANKEKKKAYDLAYNKKNSEKRNNQSKERYIKNIDRYKVLTKKYREKNKGKLNAMQKEWREKNPRDWRIASYKWKYGITLEDYKNLLEKQNGCCAICGIHQSQVNRSLHIDHCHDTNKIRGLLCQKCNSFLGLANDRIETLQSAIKYLSA